MAVAVENNLAVDAVGSVRLGLYSATTSNPLRSITCMPIEACFIPVSLTKVCTASEILFCANDKFVTNTKPNMQ